MLGKFAAAAVHNDMVLQAEQDWMQQAFTACKSLQPAASQVRTASMRA